MHQEMVMEYKSVIPTLRLSCSREKEESKKSLKV